MRDVCPHTRTWHFLGEPLPLPIHPDPAPSNVAGRIIITATRCLDCGALDRHDGNGWQGGLSRPREQV